MGLAEVERAIPCVALMTEHDGLLERQGVPYLHLAVRALQHTLAEEQYESCRLLDALQHSISGEVVSSKCGRVGSNRRKDKRETLYASHPIWMYVNDLPIVIPAAETHSFQLQVDGIGLIPS